MENFIESVENNICLWKMDEKCYKNLDMKEKVWEIIARKHRMNHAKDAKYQWKKLRDSFRDAVRRQKESGDDTKRTWIHQKQMEFLLPYMYKRSRKYISFDSPETENEGKPEQIFLEEIEEDEEEEEQLPSFSEDSVHDPPNKKFKYEFVEENFEPAIKPDENKESYVKPIIEDNSNEPLKEFFNSMYLTTSKMPLNLQLKIKRALFDAVLEAEEIMLIE